MKTSVWAIALVVCIASGWRRSLAQNAGQGACPRPEAGSTVAEPEDLRSQNGVLDVQLIAQDAMDAGGSTRYCYSDAAGRESPTLRVHPGDLVILHLKNELLALASQSVAAGQSAAASQSAAPAHQHTQMVTQMDDHACTAGIMSSVSTNLHFHGLTIPPVCHQDDVMRTSVQPGDAPFEYRFRIPQDELPGLYWYHPHIHGFSKQQLLGGASGALIVEGIERAKKAAAGLPERVFIIRDQDLVHPDAPPSKSEPVMLRKLSHDLDGDTVNSGNGFGRPAKDLSINYVPVPYPDYPPAMIQMKPGEQQLWRVLNASAFTYLKLMVMIHGSAAGLGVVAVDGAPMTHQHTGLVDPETSVRVPPGGRVEFIVKGPAEGETAFLIDKTVDTGPGGENDPNRTLAKIVASSTAPEPRSILPSAPAPLPPSHDAWLGDVHPVRERSLYFSEKLSDPRDPASAVEFYLTVEGQKPKMFDMTSGIANIIAQQGTVEDWVIENRTRELHDFHIHQLHFLLLDDMGRPLREDYLRDTVSVPYWDGVSLNYPTVRLRMDFRDPNIVGMFVYHCHILEHEDKGMMGSIRVVPAPSVGTQCEHAVSTRGPASACQALR